MVEKQSAAIAESLVAEKTSLSSTVMRCVKPWNLLLEHTLPKKKTYVSTQKKEHKMFCQVRGFSLAKDGAGTQNREPRR